MKLECAFARSICALANDWNAKQCLKDTKAHKIKLEFTWKHETRRSCQKTSEEKSVEEKPLVRLNVSEADEGENVDIVENVEKIDKSLVSDQMKMPLPEIKTKKFV